MFFVHVCLKSVISGKLKLGIFVKSFSQSRKKNITKGFSPLSILQSCESKELSRDNSIWPEVHVKKDFFLVDYKIVSVWKTLIKSYHIFSICFCLNYLHTRGNELFNQFLFILEDYDTYGLFCCDCCLFWISTSTRHILFYSF